MKAKWKTQPWKGGAGKWKSSSEKILANATSPNSGKLYLVVTSSNEAIQNGTDALNIIGKGVLDVYRGNGINWLNSYEVIYGSSRLESIIDDLSLLDGLIIFTDNTEQSLHHEFSYATQANFFKTYLQIGQEKSINEQDVRELSWVTAHELLHQYVSRIGYYVYGNIFFYQIDVGHWNDGGLLTTGDKINLEDIPTKRGTGIERISPDMIADVTYWPESAALNSEIMKYNNLVTETILSARRTAMRNPELDFYYESVRELFQGSATAIKGSPQYFDYYDSANLFHRSPKPVYLYLKNK